METTILPANVFETPEGYQRAMKVAWLFQKMAKLFTTPLPAATLKAGICIALNGMARI